MSELGQTLEKELLVSANFAKRLEFARRRKHETRQTLAKKVGISDASIWQWENAKYRPTTKHMVNLARVLSVSLEWLEHGKGDMRAPATAPLAQSEGAKELETFKEIGPDGMDLTGRLRWAKKQAGATHADLGKALGIQGSSVSVFFMDPNSPNYRIPSDDNLKKLAKALKVNFAWLKEGTGLVHISGAKFTTEEERKRAMAERLKRCAVNLGMTDKDVSEKLEIPACAFTKNTCHTASFAVASDKRLQQYAKLFDVSYSWLATGKGKDPFPPMAKLEPNGMAERLSQARANCEMGIDELSQKVGIAVSTLKKYLPSPQGGKVTTPQDYICVKLAHVMGVPFNWLYGGEGEMMPEKAEPETQDDQNTHSTSTESVSPGAEVVPGAQGDAIEKPFQEQIKSAIAATEKDVERGNKDNGSELSDDDSPAFKYFPTQDRPGVQGVSNHLTRLLAQRDDLLRQADQVQVEIDRQTVILLNQIA
jgi:transcriptional regulator with XRE-family HTH domain